MASDVAERLFQATLAQLRKHLQTEQYPMPVTSEQQCALLVCKAFLHGAAFVAEACGQNGGLYVGQANRFVSDYSKTAEGRRMSLILPGDKGWLH